jgi:hypothetical protein
MRDGARDPGSTHVARGSQPRRTSPSPRYEPFRLTPRERERFERALAAIDSANTGDPNWIWVRGRERPKELAHAELATEWIEALLPRASLELRLAARAHHVRRWEIARSDYSADRAGYLAWRRRLQEHHAEQAGILLASERYPEDTILRVQALIRKRGLGRDAEVQALEDALCLIFLETQLGELARKTPHPRMIEITKQTLAKMSTRAIELADALPHGALERELLDAALDRVARVPSGG